MKRQAFFILLFFVFAPQVFAENITTGNASAQSTVDTTVDGGSVTTHIEVEANGQKKVLDSTKPGNYKVEVKSNGSTSTAQNSISSSPSANASASPTAKVERKIGEITKKNDLIGAFVKNIIKNIFDSLKNIFRF